MLVKGDHRIMIEGWTPILKGRIKASWIPKQAYHMGSLA